ncbi:MAG: prepilin peptidase, partial [Clostridium sp.]|nr:prepilin peptidase [Clostridium sp.]
NIFFAFIVGGIVAAIILIVKKKKGKEAIAFGPYLAIGCLFSIFFGNTIINMYISNFLQL